VTSFEHLSKRPNDCLNLNFSFFICIFRHQSLNYQVTMNRKLIKHAHFSRINLFILSLSGLLCQVMQFQKCRKKTFHCSQENWALYTLHQLLSKGNKILNMKYEASASVSKIIKHL